MHPVAAELKTLRTPLMRWRHEVLAYFLCRFTNGRVEGFNGKAKLVIRRAYGYKSFRDYSLLLLKLLCLKDFSRIPTIK